MPWSEEIWGTILWNRHRALKWRQLFPTSETSNLPIMQAHHAFISVLSKLLKALSRKGLMATRYLQQLMPRRGRDVLYLRKNSLYHAELSLCTSGTIHYWQVCPQNLEEENTTSCLNCVVLQRGELKHNLRITFSFPAGFTQIFIHVMTPHNLDLCESTHSQKRQSRWATNPSLNTGIMLPLERVILD